MRGLGYKRRGLGAGPIGLGSTTTLGVLMGLQRFEQGLERMVEGVFSRSSRSTIRPVELGRRLLREMDDHRSVTGDGRRIVPNSFTFHLSARDHAGFADIERALVTELTEAGREYAHDEGYHLVGPISVALLVDNNLKPGRFGIASVVRETVVQTNQPVFPPIEQAVEQPANQQIVVPPPERQIEIPEAAPLSSLVADLDAAEAAAAAGVVEAVPVPEPAPTATFAAAAAAAAEPESAASEPPIRGELVMPSGKRVAVGEDTITIGRLPACELSVNDPNVSRRHAQVRPTGPDVVVVDLGSTNGTKVNGQRIKGEQAIVDGDIISLGATHLRFEAS